MVTSNCIHNSEAQQLIKLVNIGLNMDHMNHNLVLIEHNLDNKDHMHNINLVISMLVNIIMDSSHHNIVHSCNNYNLDLNFHPYNNQ